MLSCVFFFFSFCIITISLKEKTGMQMRKYVVLVETTSGWKMTVHLLLHAMSVVFRYAGLAMSMSVQKETIVLNATPATSAKKVGFLILNYGTIL